MEALELAVLEGIQTVRCGVLDGALAAVSRLSDHGEIWILLAVVLMVHKPTRRQGAALGLSLALDGLLCNAVLKPWIGRARPFVGNPGIVPLIPPPPDGSFPSGHTAVCFTSVLALKRSGSPLWKLSLVLAVVTAFSRLYLQVHWPSDVAGGVVLGCFAGWAGAELERRLFAVIEARDSFS